MEIKTDVPLAPYTTLNVGGPAQYVCEVTTVEDVEQARQFALQTAVPVLVLGAGSNLLVSDEGFAGLVLLNRLTGRSYQKQADGREVLATFGAGEVLDDVIAETVVKGYWGLENLSHIPGTVGATPVQNVGAYGVEVSDLISSLTATNLKTGEQSVFSNTNCRFGYRDSFFKTESGRDWCITSVTYRLSAAPQPKLAYKDLASLADDTDPAQSDIRDQVIAIRSQKFPDWHTVGTAGSFFKNPIIPIEQANRLLETHPELPMFPVTETQVKVSLGYILDKICGLKGWQDNGVKLYERQALVLVNEGKSAAAIKEFATTVKENVYAKTGIIIEQEVTAV